MNSLLVDNTEKARQNRERVAKGYSNGGYDAECNSMRGVENVPEPSWETFYAMESHFGRPWRYLAPTREITLVIRDYDLEWDE